MGHLAVAKSAVGKFPWHNQPVGDQLWDNPPWANHMVDKGLV